MKEKCDAKKNDKKNTTVIVDSDIDIVYDESSVIFIFHTNDW